MYLAQFPKSREDGKGEIYFRKVSDNEITLGERIITGTRSIEAVANDDKYSYYGDQDGLILRVLTLQTGGATHAEEFAAHDSKVTQLRRIDNYLVSASWDDTIKVWDTYRDTFKLLHTIPGKGMVKGLDVKRMNDKIYIFSWSRYGEVEIRDMTAIVNGDGDVDSTVLVIENDDFSECHAVEFHPTTNHLIIGCAAGPLFVYKIV